MSSAAATRADELALSKILVIDDDEVDRVTLRRFLGKAGISAVIDELIRAKPSAAKGRYLRTITVASTMGPGVKVDPSRTRDIVEEAAPATA